MRIVKRYVLPVAFGLLATLVLDSTLRLTLDSSTSFEFKKSIAAKSRTLIVYLEGILADGDGSSRSVIGSWQKRGDVLLVDYVGDRFKPDDIIRDVAGKVTELAPHYDRVVFIGASMGGLLSYDVMMKIEDLDLNIVFILVDAPTRRVDFQSPLDKLSLAMYAWWAGPISNLFSGLYFDATFRGPKDENIEPDVDRDELAKRVEEAKSHALSWHNDEIRYIVMHRPLEPSSLKSTPLVYMRSTRDDDTVRPTAFEPWRKAADGAILRLMVDSTHAGFNERPRTWNNAFNQAFNLLLGAAD